MRFAFPLCSGAQRNKRQLTSWATFGRPIFLQSHLRYSHIADVFANHVGDDALGVPWLVACSPLRYPHNVNYIISKYHTAQHFQHGTPTQHCKNSNLATPRNGTSYFCKAEIAPLPYILVLWLVVPQNRYALCGFYFVQLDRKKRCRDFSPTPLFYYLYFCVLLVLFLHRLVGLRLLRLCLKLRRGFAP